MFKLAVILAVALIAVAGASENGTPEPYSFAYNDPLNTHGQAEQSDGDVTRGFYYVSDPENGHQRRVDYVADSQGFRASVQSNHDQVVGNKQQTSAAYKYGNTLYNQAGYPIYNSAAYNRALQGTNQLGYVTPYANGYSQYNNLGLLSGLNGVSGYGLSSQLNNLYRTSANAANGVYQTGANVLNGAYQTGLSTGNGLYQTGVNAGNGLYQSGLVAGNGLYRNGLLANNGVYQTVAANNVYNPNGYYTTRGYYSPSSLGYTNSYYSLANPLNTGLYGYGVSAAEINRQLVNLGDVNARLTYVQVPTVNGIQTTVSAVPSSAPFVTADGVSSVSSFSSSIDSSASPSSSSSSSTVSQSSDSESEPQKKRA